MEQSSGDMERRVHELQITIAAVKLERAAAVLKDEIEAKKRAPLVLRNKGGRGRTFNSSPYTRPPRDIQGPLKQLEIEVDGHTFTINKGGNKLTPVLDYRIKMEDIPETVTHTTGAKFFKARDDIWYREGTRSPSNHLCRNFTRLGFCIYGDKCHYRHEADKVAICKRFLQGSCSRGLDCNLSHDPTPHRVPPCVHFLLGKCNNSECLYPHLNDPEATPFAPVCYSFATTGYCDLGAACTDRHAFECPSYSNKGECLKENCRLHHIDRAAAKRKKAAQESHKSPEDAAPVAMDQATDVIMKEGTDISMPEALTDQGDPFTDRGFAEQADFVPIA